MPIRPAPREARNGRAKASKGALQLLAELGSAGVAFVGGQEGRGAERGGKDRRWRAGEGGPGAHLFAETAFPPGEVAQDPTRAIQRVADDGAVIKAPVAEVPLGREPIVVVATVLARATEPPVVGGELDLFRRRPHGRRSLSLTCASRPSILAIDADTPGQVRTTAGALSFLGSEARLDLDAGPTEGMGPRTTPASLQGPRAHVRPRRDPGRPPRVRPRRLAALRLPGQQRAGPAGPRPRRQAGRHRGGSSTSIPAEGTPRKLVHRIEPGGARPPARREGGLPPLAGARGGRRPTLVGGLRPGGDGILARGTPTPTSPGSTPARSSWSAACGRRGRLLGRPDPAVRGDLGRRPVADAPRGRACTPRRPTTWPGA